jgi:negative regulator of sigma E activity
MNKPEILSALLDDEGSQEELVALGHLAGDAQARDLWYRYQLIGDMLRDGGSGVGANRRFADSVQKRLADDMLPDAEAGDGATAHVIPLSAAQRPARDAASTSGRATITWRPALGLAAAASVTAFVLGLWTAGPAGDGLPVAAHLSVQGATGQDALEPMPVPAAVQAMVSGVGQAEQVSSLPEAEYRRRMDNYLMNFNEQRARMGMPQAHAYVRVVGFDSPNEQP